MKVSIIGAGAIGCFIAAQLDANGIDYEILVRSSNILASDPNFKVEGSINYMVHNTSLISTIDEITGDVIFVTTKSTANKDIFPKFSGFKNKTIIILQNGIGEEEKLAALMDDSNNIIASTSNIKVTKQANIIRLQTDLYDLLYAYVKLNKIDTNVEIMFDKIFSSTNRFENAYQAKFKKILISASCNGLSTVTGVDMYTMATEAKHSNRIRNVASEVIKVARNYGVSLPKEIIDNILSTLSNPQYKGAYFSMKHDYDQGKELEVGSIYSNLIELANAKAIKMPYTIELRDELLKLT